MHSDLYWIETGTQQRLAIMARPRAGDWLEDEVAHWQGSGVGIVVSLLERDEVGELGLSDEPALCAGRGIEFLSFPIPDRGTPDRMAMQAFAADLATRGKPIAIHCRAGVGRSSLVAAAVMIAGGADPAEALAAIRTARGTPIPDTDAQREWVMSLGF